MRNASSFGLIVLLYLILLASKEEGCEIHITPANYTAGTSELLVQPVGCGPGVSIIVEDLHGDSVARGPRLSCGVLDPGIYMTKATLGKRTLARRELKIAWPKPTLKLDPQGPIQTHTNVIVQLSFPTAICRPPRPQSWIQLLYCGPSPSQCLRVIFSQQVNGFPGKTEIRLNCELLGQAGHYLVSLSPHQGGSPLVAVQLRAEWSSSFVLNVGAGPVLPCQPPGLPVLFQYPSCSGGGGGDRIRLYGRLGATLHYLAEHPVAHGAHAVRFDCTLFQEKYSEYCWAYVSRALTGAFSDVRMDCVPTLPQGPIGNWGPWGEWSECRGGCGGGTKSRWRICGGGGCGGGTAAESRPCGRCGCALRVSETGAIIGGCPTGGTWTLRGPGDSRLRMNVLRTPCPGQRLTILDSSGTMARILSPALPPPLISTNETLIIRLSSGDEICETGFLAKVESIITGYGSNLIDEEITPKSNLIAGAADLSLAIALMLALAATVCLCVQFAYQKAKYPGAGSRATSASTLLSELTGLRPLLRESTREEELFEKPVKHDSHSDKTNISLGSQSRTSSTTQRYRLAVSEELSNNSSELTTPTPSPMIKRHYKSNGSSTSKSSSSTLTNGKELKEKKNVREKMLGGSEVSLEMDYYDYNVENAAGPGSYLAMDPAYCLWIPPFAPGPIYEDTDLDDNNSLNKLNQEDDERLEGIKYVDEEEEDEEYKLRKELLETEESNKR